MPYLDDQLDLDRCPHCSVATPMLVALWRGETCSQLGATRRFWSVYECKKCGGLVTAYALQGFGTGVVEMYPESMEVDDAIPDRARSYLQQAFDSLHSPAGAVMLAASAVDAMLKDRGYKDGSLYSRIDKAATEHLITQEMATWAHQVRLDANEQRHADEAQPLPTEADAKRCVEFATALGQFMFVLPARVQRGLEDAKKPAAASAGA